MGNTVLLLSTKNSAPTYHTNLSYPPAVHTPFCTYNKFLHTFPMKHSPDFIDILFYPKHNTTLVLVSTDIRYSTLWNNISLNRLTLVQFLPFILFSLSLFLLFSTYPLSSWTDRKCRIEFSSSPRWTLLDCRFSGMTVALPRKGNQNFVMLCCLLEVLSGLGMIMMTTMMITMRYNVTLDGLEYAW